jgi:hypothetical protein
MTVHDQRIIGFAPRAAEAGIHAVMGTGVAAIAAQGGRLFAVFKPVIGMPVNRAVVVTEWPDEASALAHGALVHEALAGTTLIEQDLWRPSARPLPGTRPSDQGGYYSHRAFDIQTGDWPRFLQLSVEAWGNFEDVHASKVTGFWQCGKAPGPGLLRVRLMAWYQSLDAWERSRHWNPAAKAGSNQAFEKFRERQRMLIDTHVSILARVPLPGESANPATALI